MILSNVNIGTGPSTGDGDPLRTAFNVINQNFALISANANVLTQGIGVRSVAGRQGNVLITVNDVIGISSYPNTSTVSSWITSNVAALVDSAPDTLNTLNEIAAALNDDANVYTTLVTSITTANTAMKGYVDGQVTSLTSNAAVQAGQIVDANTAMRGYVDGQVTSLTSNAAVQAGLIADNASAITTANTALKGYVDSEISTVNGNITTANTAMKGYVDSVANLTYYGNANVASYLPTYSGNIKVDTVTYEDLSEQTTAYTGQQFRTNLSGNGLTVKPAFLAYNPGYGAKPTIDTHFGFDSGGMWFTGNANDERAFPIRTNFHFHDTDVVEVTATINFATASDDHGMAIFPVNTNPYWKFSTFAGRIQFNYNVGIPQLWGTANSSVAGSSVLSAGNYYTFKFTYDPTQSTVTVQTFSGNTAVGSPLDTRSITENLNATEFVVGFDADQDNLANKSYFTGLTIKTLTNGVFNDLEITNDLTVDGDIISLGNIAGLKFEDISGAGGGIKISGPVTENSIVIDPGSSSNGVIIGPGTWDGQDFQGLQFRPGVIQSGGSGATLGLICEGDLTLTTEAQNSDIILNPGNYSYVDLQTTKLKLTTNSITLTENKDYDDWNDGQAAWADIISFTPTGANRSIAIGNPDEGTSFTFINSSGTYNVDLVGGPLLTGTFIHTLLPGESIVLTQDPSKLSFGDAWKIVSGTSYVSTANSAVVGYIDDAVSTLTSNAAVQAGLIANNSSAITTANLAMVGYVDNAVSTANIALKGYADATFLTSTLGASLNANSYDITGWNNLTGQSGGTVSGFTTLTGDSGGTISGFTNITLDSGGTISQFTNLTGDSGGTISQFTNITGDSGGTISQFTDITGDSGGNISQFTNIIGDGGGSITGFDIDWNLIQNTPTTISGYGITDAYGDANVAAYTGNISAQVNGYDIGYRDIPQVTAGNVTLALADRGKHYYATSAAPLTLTVPSNANVAFPIGTAISIVNKGTANLTVALEAEASMYLAGNATSASRTITTYGMATLMKTATDEWFINGTGVV